MEKLQGECSCPLPVIFLGLNAQEAGKPLGSTFSVECGMVPHPLLAPLLGGNLGGNLDRRLLKLHYPS